MKCICEGRDAILVGPFPVPFLSVIAKLVGEKQWLSSATVKIVDNDYNRNLLSPHVEFDIKPSPTVDARFADEGLEPFTFAYRPKMELRTFQQECLQLSWDKPEFAIFAEMGLGKTAVEIANIGMLAFAGRITGVLIFAPNGVHAQWLEDEFPKHADPNFRAKLQIWDGEPKHLSKFGNDNFHVEILSMNIDAIRLKRVKRKIVHVSEGLDVAHDFIDAHNGRVMIIVDESHGIKNYKSQRTKAAWVLGRRVAYRRILTGTPISRNLVDAWSQFQFLNPDILGYRNIVAFRSHFCIMGGYEGKQIVGAQNIEEFYSIIAPHTYRKTKAEVTDLPPKVYAEREYVMSDETRRHYASMKKQWLTRFDNGEIKDAKNGLAALLRLQQIVCGFLEREDGTIETLGCERLDAMMEIIEQTEGHTIIWARFSQNIRDIAAALRAEYGDDCCVTYDGSTSDAERKEAKRRFTNRECRFFIGNIGISAGLDGLQVAGTMIFYSSDFDAIHRWQSEDRGHRFGMQESLTIFDLVARGSVDRTILRNLSGKKSLSELSLDQIRQALIEN